MTKFIRSSFISILFLSLLALPAMATPIGNTINPGDNLLTVPAISSYSGTLLVQKVMNFVGNPDYFNGTLWAAVYQDPNGGLDFLYQVRNDATSQTTLQRFTTNSFADPFVWGTAVSYLTVIPTGWESGILGTVAPQTANRSAEGSTIGFLYAAGASGITPGATSYIMMVDCETCRWYGTGHSQVIDGGVWTGETYAPAVPEPITAGLIGTGLIGLSLLRRRKTMTS